MKALPALHAAGVGLSGAAVVVLALQLAGATKRESAALEGAATERTRAAAELSETRARLAGELKRTSDAEHARDALQSELLTANDRLEKAYKDIAEMESQLVQVSRDKNGMEVEVLALQAKVKALQAEIAKLKDHAIEVMPSPPEPPAIEGTVLGVSDKVNLVLISVGKDDKVEMGMTFTVNRGADVVSKLMVDKVENGWASCRELKEAHKQQIQQGDQVKQDRK